MIFIFYPYKQFIIISKLGIFHADGFYYHLVLYFYEPKNIVINLKNNTNERRKNNDGEWENGCS